MGHVLHYYQYLHPRSDRVYTTRYFCGDCRREIGTPYAFATTPEDLEAQNADSAARYRREDAPLEHFSFCPWCGVEFEGEWWKNCVIQNERPIDHYQNPGTHKGDQHVFEGESPHCVEGHWLGVSGGDEVCWCDPIIEPNIMGCTIRHQAKDYVAVMDQRQAAATRRDEEREGEE